MALSIVNDGSKYGRVLLRNLEWMNNAIAELCGLQSAEIENTLQISGTKVRLPITARQKQTISLLTPAGKTLDTFTLQPGEVRNLDHLSHGVYILCIKGLTPIKILI